MPELDEVLDGFPGQAASSSTSRSNEAREGDMLAASLREHPAWRKAVWGAYGGDPPTSRPKPTCAELNVWTRTGLRAA